MSKIQEIIDKKLTIELDKADFELLSEIQTKLTALNYFFTEIDGQYGSQTAGAWASFKSNYHLDAYDYIGAGSLSTMLKAKPRVLSEYAAGYAKLWYAARIKFNKIADCDYVINHKFLPNQGLYQQVQDKTGVPWFVVAVLHSRESDCDFNTHLFNGDPLTHKTVNVPAGQPKGTPPFTWQYSAICSIEYDGLDQVKNWAIENILYQCEKYNGLGYWSHNINSPYVWAGTNQYDCGKYTADGYFDCNAVDDQLGTAALLLRLWNRKIIHV